MWLMPRFYSGVNWIELHFVKFVKDAQSLFPLCSTRGFTREKCDQRHVAQRGRTRIPAGDISPVSLNPSWNPTKALWLSSTKQTLWTKGCKRWSWRSPGVLFTVCTIYANDYIWPWEKHALCFCYKSELNKTVLWVGACIAVTNGIVKGVASICLSIDHMTSLREDFWERGVSKWTFCRNNYASWSPVCCSFKRRASRRLLCSFNRLTMIH